MVLERKSVGIGNRNLVVEPGELLLPAIVLLFSAYYYIDTYALPERSTIYAHPILYFTVALAVMVVVTHGVTLEKKSVDELQEERSSTDAEGMGENEDQPSDSAFTKRTAVGLVVLSFAYYLLLPIIGFIPVTAGFAAGALYLFGERNWLFLALYSIGFTLLVWGVFVQWLRIPIPTLL